MRFDRHLEDSVWKTCPIYVHMRKIGQRFFRIELIEEVNDNNKKDAEKKESYWIKRLDSFNNGLNAQLPSRTRKEYYEDNKDKLVEKQREFYEERKQDILEYQKQYYEEHKQKKLEYQKQYREAHKQQISEKEKKYREVIIFGCKILDKNMY
jgi:cell division protein FtsN